MLEVELKFIAEGPAPLDLLATATELGRASLGPADTYDELDRYLDTADGRLAAERWACRLRTRRGATIISLKGPAEPSLPGEAPALHRRPEVEGPASNALTPDAWPPSEARDRLLALSAGGRLVERLALAQRRTERAVEIDGRRTGLLSLDRVTVRHEGVEMGRLWSVELESVDETAAGLEALGGALAATPGLLPDPLTKLERAVAIIRHASA